MDFVILVSNRDQRLDQKVLRNRDDFKDGSLFYNVETLANLTYPSYANYKCLAIFL
jgi:hypothetical protein